MSRKYLPLAVTPAVRAAEAHYYGAGRTLPAAQDLPDDALGQDEADFVATRDSFYIATVTEEGWPYIQHRGGPIGFLRVRDAGRTLAFADLGGNRQLLSVGNLQGGNDRVALFLMDYPHRERLKVNGHARVVDARDEPALAAELASGCATPVKVERVILISVVAYDWNCSQHITPRFTAEEIDELSL